MKLSLQVHTGKVELPAVLLIHGLGMNSNFWVAPEKCFILGGLAPLTIFLTNTFEKGDKTISFGLEDPGIQGLWHCLKAAGFSLASWTQSQPLGPIQLAVDELRTVIDTIRSKWPDKSIYIIGHSRGGLVARRLLLENNSGDIDGFITICSPHSGTGMAKFARYLKPAGTLLQKIIPHNSKAALTKALNRLAAFLQSPAIAELTPESAFIASIQKPLPKELRTLSFGGTNPALFQAMVNMPGDHHKIIRFPSLLAGIIPAGHYPEELTPGLGDGLVSAASARLAAGRHHDFPANHVKAAFVPEIHGIILDFLNEKHRADREY